MAFIIPKNHLQIDTIRFGVAYDGRIDGLKYRAASGTNNESEARGSDFLRFRGEHASSMQIEHDKNGQLIIEGSPHAYFYGQNAYTGEDLKVCLRAMINIVGKKLGFDNTKIKQLRSAPKTLLRVDIAANFRLDSVDEVQDVLKQMARQLVERDPMLTVYHGSVYYKPQGGRQFTVASYAKGPQLVNRHRKIRTTDPVLLQLAKDSMNILRVEVRLMAERLRHLHLSDADDWTRQTVREVYAQHFEHMELLDVLSGPLDLEHWKDLNGSELRFLVAHHSTIPMKSMYSASSTKKKLASFRKRGIDLRVPHSDEHRIPLLEKLCPAKIAPTPAWVVVAKRAYSPKTKTKAKPTAKGRLIDLEDVKVTAEDRENEHALIADQMAMKAQRLAKRAARGEETDAGETKPGNRGATKSKVRASSNARANKTLSSPSIPRRKKKPYPVDAHLADAPPVEKQLMQVGRKMVRPLF
ncbi:phage/plasmid replication protein, II/X family [Pigmentiphaga kullae]|uniref:II/X family phage/plasmid replication protein n=1 Tax=Pigmentiphaga kullae TaxID=151784 RepID=A0A4Q7NMX2_9BURK|nr:phage/plasmid replication protein, II/X family [Pigmentiphaga kullae]RZS86561.1 II/X family phage/plasmid replication protein [Pigmentiphaga kullae]